MPGKIEGLLNGWGMRADKGERAGFGHAGLNGDRQQRWVAVKKEGGGAEDGGTSGGLVSAA